jgi:outer membrane protein assembly factor BamD (BamD/ComL family)
MSKIDASSSASAALSIFRIVAVMVLFLTITASGLQVLGAINVMDHPDPNAPVAVPTLFIPPLLTLIAGVALSTLLEGIARLVAAQPSQTPDHTASTVKLMMTLSDLQNSLPGQIGKAIQQSVAQIQPPTVAPAEASVGPDLQQHLERMVTLLEEMKELSMLDETQRKTRRNQIALRRKNARLEEAANLIQQNNWAQADALLHLLESLHPGDPEVLAARNLLDDSRIISQSNEWEMLAAKVSDLLALSNYTAAIESVNAFLERYPAHLECQELARRIGQEERISIDSAANQLYDQIKSAVENRQWRTALDGIQQFLERHPEHARADKIRKQVRVIQKNAEIEERHEKEDRIKQLINTRRFNEAADLSEDLLQRFPDSPQAAYLSDLLPKLRERSLTGETQGIAG